MLSRKDLLSKATVRTKDVEITGGAVRVRELNGTEREAFIALSDGDTVDLTNAFQARLAAQCVIDENGDAVFELDDIEQINQAMGGSALQAVVLAILGLSGLTDDSVADLEKNSDGELSVVHGSDSPKRSAAQ